jgi:hypothetical protein
VIDPLTFISFFFGVLHASTVLISLSLLICLSLTSGQFHHVKLMAIIPYSMTRSKDESIIPFEISDSVDLIKQIKHR